MTGVRILIIEDEILTGETLRRTLLKAGHAPLGPAATLDEAVALANQTPPDIILADVHLEGDGDGIQAARLLQRHFDCEVIYLTAYSNTETVERAKLTGPVTYLLKPCSAAQVSIAVEMAIQHRERRRHVTSSRNAAKALTHSIASAEIRLAQNLKLLMKARGLKLSRIARETGIPKQCVSDWIKGTVPKNPVQLGRLASCLGTSIEELCFSPDPRPSTSSLK